MLSYNRHDIEDVLEATSKTLKESMRVGAENYLKAADAAAAVKKFPGWDDLLPLLASRANNEIEDLVVLQKIAVAFKGHESAASEAPCR